MKEKLKERFNFAWKIGFLVLLVYVYVKTNLLFAVAVGGATLLLIWMLNQYQIPRSYTMLFTGQPGSGKDVTAVPIAISMYYRNLRKVQRYNFFHPHKRMELPRLYSNIGLRIGKAEWSYVLEADHLLLRKSVPRYSVFYVSELTKFVSQYDWQNPNVVKNLEEFFTMNRNYNDICFIANTQAFDKAPKQLREILGSYIHCRSFRKFLRFYEVSVRNVSCINDVEVQVQGNVEEAYSKIRGIFPKIKQFDSNCYRHLYFSVPRGSDQQWTDYAARSYLDLPKEWTPPLTGLADPQVYLDQITALTTDIKVCALLRSFGYLDSEGHATQTLMALDSFTLRELLQKVRKIAGVDQSVT